MRTKFPGYARRDWVIACILTLVLFILVGMQLTRGMTSWGDDFAAYISEGIAISTGTLQDQAEKNYILHPSTLPDMATEEGLVYVWGLPLPLALVHRLVGFDRVNYSSVIWYKVPSLIALALTAGVLYLFYRRRFSEDFSIFLAILFCCHLEMPASVDRLNVDILFLLVFQLSLLLADSFYDICLDPKKSPRFRSLGIGLGIAMWCTYVTRLNGITILAVVAMGHALRLIASRKKLSLQEAVYQLLPYLVFIALRFGSRLFLPDATSNLSDVGKAAQEVMLENLKFYLALLKSYANHLIGFCVLPLWLPMALLALLGLCTAGFSRENLPFTILLVGTIAVLAGLPYIQGLRYMFNILPILLMYAAMGGMQAGKWIRAKLPMLQKVSIVRPVAAALLIFVVACQLLNGVVNVQSNRQPTVTDVYSEKAIEAYHYIQENIPEDALIGFVKPRALYLNTERMSFRLGQNGRDLEDADYYLVTPVVYEYHDWEILNEQQDSIRLLWSNDVFELYEVVK